MMEVQDKKLPACHTKTRLTGKSQTYCCSDATCDLARSCGFYGEPMLIVSPGVVGISK